MPLGAYIRGYVNRPMVRPYALAAPILILLFCLPLLRPLVHTEPAQDESMRLATVESLLKHRTLALDQHSADDLAQSPGLVRVNGKLYSDQPPLMAVLLSGPAWLMHRLGYDLATDPETVAYILTLIGVTLPVAAAAGILYRMARLFELRRPFRALIALGVVVGSGLLSYAVVLNAQAPAACLLIAAAACLIHVESSRRPRRSAGWIFLGGVAAALAMAFDPAAGLIALPLVFVIAVTRFSIRFRIGGAMLFVLGMLPVVGLHAAFNRPITGDLLPASFHRELFARGSQSSPDAIPPEEDADDVIARPGFWRTFGNTCEWLATALVGSHGLLSHFPILILGVGGVGAVMHRHWPSPVKVLAAISLFAATVAMIIFCWLGRDWRDAMFATRWFVPLLPLLLFWAGAWTRRPHSQFGWTVAALLLGYSTLVGIIGATNPVPREGYSGYTAEEALARLISPPKPAADVVARR